MIKSINGIFIMIKKKKWEFFGLMNSKRGIIVLVNDQIHFFLFSFKKKKKKSIVGGEGIFIFIFIFYKKKPINASLTKRLLA